MTDDEVTFRWKDYRHHSKSKVMTLDAHEFIRRFLLHTLPDGFHRIRHYGFLANGHRAEKLALCRTLLEVAPAEPTAPQSDDRGPQRVLYRCPCCGGTMITLATLPRPHPRRPSFWHDTS
jgi:Putative transposase